MASTIPKPLKQLGELLQEQQEPFILEVFLHERRCLKKRLNSDDSFGCYHANSSKSLKRSASCGLNKRRKGIPHCSKILRAVFKKLVSIGEKPRVKHSDHGDGKFSVATEMGRKKGQEVAEPDRFSSATSTTVFNSCSESDIEDHISSTADTCQASKFHNRIEKEVATDRKLQWRAVKQFSPVSVLEEVPSEEGSPIHNNTRHHSRIRQEDNTSTSNCILRKNVTEGSILSASPSDRITQHHSRTRQEEHTSTTNFILRRKLTDDSILSASLWELLLQSPTEMPSCTGVAELQELAAELNASSHCLKSKRVLQQSKQLLFDCVREVVESHGGKERKQQQLQAFLGPEELGKLICEKLRAWGKQCGDEPTITQLLHLDFLASAEEWGEFEPGTREIAMKIGDAIWEEISNEIVTEIIDIFSNK